MQTYLVGGAVRDTLLGHPVKDRDWVVVGATPAQMLAAGYVPVGKDFPVFLHPHTKEEYALARTERKSGRGYTGFECYSGSDVTLEQDLMRRDLTINAMAMDDNGRIVDPWGGRNDLEKRLLRHVSPAFVEDPLRVLRVARFHARYAGLGFEVAPETLKLMHELSSSGELEALVAERVWTETAKALSEKFPQAYIQTLRNCGALAIILPELNALWGIPQPEKHHPEIDTGIHQLLALQEAKILCDQAGLSTENRIDVLFAVLMHDLGKALTPADILPAHHGHEDISAFLSEKVCNRLKVPNHTRMLAEKVARFHTHAHKAFELRPATLMRTLEALDYLRRPHVLELFLLACEADARGRTGFETQEYPQADMLTAAAAAAKNVQAAELQKAFGYNGKTLGEELRKRRIKAIAQVKTDFIGPG